VVRSDLVIVMLRRVVLMGVLYVLEITGNHPILPYLCPFPIGSLAGC